MKDYNIILSTVKHSLKYHSKDHAMGYIYALWEWRVINLETYDKLEYFIKKSEEKVNVL